MENEKLHIELLNFRDELLALSEKIDSLGWKGFDNYMSPIRINVVTSGFYLSNKQKKDIEAMISKYLGLSK